MAAAAGSVRLIVSIPIALTFALVVSSQVLRQETIRELGVRFDNFLHALKLLLLPMMVVAIISLLISKPTFPWPDVDVLVDHVTRAAIFGVTPR